MGNQVVRTFLLMTIPEAILVSTSLVSIGVAIGSWTSAALSKRTE